MSLASIQRQQKDKPYSYLYYLARKRGYTHEEALRIAYKKQIQSQINQGIQQAANDAAEKKAKDAAEKARMDQYLIAGGTTGGLIGGPIIADQIMSKGGEEVGKELVKQGAETALTQGATQTAGAEAALKGGSLVTEGGNLVAPAGQAVPEGFTAVGSSASGGTIVMPQSSGSSFGELAGQYAPYLPAALAATHLLPGALNILRGKDNKKRYADAAYDALTIGANFIPVVGPFAALGMGLFRKPGMKLAEKAFGVSKTKVEEDRIRRLIESGAITEEQAAVMFGDRYNPEGNSTFTQRGQDKQLADILAAGGKENYAGFDDSGKWYNSAFLANKGDETYLAPEDVWGYSSNIEAYPDWLNVPEWVRRAAAKEALAKGMYREHHGTIDINDPVAFAELVDQILANEKTYGAGTEYQPEAEAGGYYWDPIEHKYKRAGEKEVKEETGVDLNSQGAPKL